MTEEQAPIFAQPIGIKYSFYITGEIQEPEYYSQWFQTIREATEQDQVFFHINSPGGNLYTAIQFLRVMHDCQAPVIGSLEGEACSAAGVLFLACDYYQISPYATFMAHNYSSGAFGKGGEQYDRIMYERKWSTDIVNGIYEGFLTSKEMAALLDNKDIWLGADEISNRLDKKIHHEQRMIKKMMKEAQHEQHGTTQAHRSKDSGVTDGKNILGKE